MSVKTAINSLVKAREDDIRLRYAVKESLETKGALATRAVTSADSAHALSGGRVVKNYEKAFEFYALQPPYTGISRWRTRRYTERELLALPTEQLLEVAIELVPSVDKALYDWQIFCNPGYDLQVEPKAALVCCENFLDKLNQRPHENFSSLINQVFDSLFIKGGALMELILSPDVMEALTIAVMEPDAVKFRKIDDPVIGMHWQMGQWQGTRWEPIEDDTVKFVSLRPKIDNPYGRPMITSAIIPSIFLLVFMRELREVVKHQGYPRLDIEIIGETVRMNAPDHILGDPEKETAYMHSIIQQIDATMKKLEPRDVYIHMDDVKLNQPVGTVNHQVLQGIDIMIDHETKQIIQGLKTMAVLLGHNDTTTETYATREWEIYMAAIRSAQFEVATVLTQFLKLVCQIEGVHATQVSFKFRELRDSEALRYAQVDKQNLENLQLKQELLTAGVSEDDIESALQSGLRH